LAQITLVAFLGLLWRIFYIQCEGRRIFFTDESWYVIQAQRLVTGHPWTDAAYFSLQPSAAHGPITSMLMAPFAWIFPHSSIGLRPVMAVVGSMVVVAIGLLGRQLLSPRVGLIAAIIAAVYPGLWIRDGLVVSEPITILILIGLVSVGYRQLEKASLPLSALMGGLLGLIALARSETLLLAFLFAVPIVVVAYRRLGASWPKALLALLLTGVVSMAVMAPWVAYNQGRFTHSVLLSNNLGHTLAGGYCGKSFYGSQIGYDSFDCANKAEAAARLKSKDETVISGIERKQALSFASHHLSRIPLVMLMREAWMIGLYHPEYVVASSVTMRQQSWATWLDWVGFLTLIPLAIFGFLEAKRRQLTRWPLVMLIVNTIMTTAMFYGHWRYRLTASLAMILFAALAIDALLARRQSRQTPS